jgi:hypothetical protein
MTDTSATTPRTAAEIRQELARLDRITAPTPLSVLRRLLAVANLSDVDEQAAGHIKARLDAVAAADPDGTATTRAWMAMAGSPASAPLMRLAAHDTDPKVRAMSWTAPDHDPQDAAQRWLNEPSELVRVAAVAAGHISTDTITRGWLPATEELWNAVATSARVDRDLEVIPTSVWVSLLRLPADLFDAPSERIMILQRAVAELPDVTAHVLANPASSVSHLLIACLSPFATDDDLLAAFARLRHATPTREALNLLRVVETRAEREGASATISAAILAREKLIEQWKCAVGETGPVTNLSSSYPDRVEAIENADSPSALLYAVANTPSRSNIEMEERVSCALLNNHMNGVVYELLAQHPHQKTSRLRELLAVTSSLRWVWDDQLLLVELLTETGNYRWVGPALVESVPQAHEPSWTEFEEAVAQGMIALPPRVWALGLPWTNNLGRLATRMPAGVALGTSLRSPELAAAVLSLMAPVLADPSGIAALESFGHDDPTPLGEAVAAITAATT